ncbi:MAG TPA: CD225/dispanin family protein [Thermoanaerobaculia bacterium]|nr:CD225/dispanin family protein [Thermoanaerobaculia bacterium]
MYCTYCGAERADSATACPQCGRPVAEFAAPDEVPNHLVQSILVTLCCCLPLGIVALVYSSQVNTKLAHGDVSGARIASARARTWVIVSFIGGLLSAGGFAAFTYLNQ